MSFLHFPLLFKNLRVSPVTEWSRVKISPSATSRTCQLSMASLPPGNDGVQVGNLRISKGPPIFRFQPFVLGGKSNIEKEKTSFFFHNFRFFFTCDCTYWSLRHPLEKDCRPRTWSTHGTVKCWWIILQENPMALGALGEAKETQGLKSSYHFNNSQHVTFT